MIQHLVVQRGEEFRQTHAFLRRDLLQSVPERHFEPDRRGVSVDPERARLRFIVALRLMREQMAHGSLPAERRFVETIYRAARPHNAVEYRGACSWAAWEGQYTQRDN